MPIDPEESMKLNAKTLATIVAVCALTNVAMGHLAASRAGR